jgi:hypothetical protein
MYNILLTFLVFFVPVILLAYWWNRKYEREKHLYSEEERRRIEDIRRSRNSFGEPNNPANPLYED